MVMEAQLGAGDRERGVSESWSGLESDRAAMMEDVRTPSKSDSVVERARKEMTAT